jgi:hypothetical protein
MYTNQKIGLALAVIGFAILIAGSIGYMGVYYLDTVVSYVLMGLGLAMVVASLVLVSLVKGADGSTKEVE